MSRSSFGSVRKRRNGKWEARYHDRRGEVHYTYFMTKAEATPPSRRSSGHVAGVLA